MDNEHSPELAADNPPPRVLKWLPTWELFALFIGDWLTLLIFAWWGQSTHQLLASNDAPLRAIITTAAPFMVGWLLVGMVIGTYRGTALYPLGRVIWLTALAGLIAGPIGGVFWALSRNHWPVPIFYVITTALTTAVLVVWRVIWSRIRRLWWPELPI
jgi:hypothetical protein